MKIQVLMDVRVSGYTGQREAYEERTRDCIVELFDDTTLSLIIDEHTKEKVTFDFFELQDAYDALKAER